LVRYRAIGTGDIYYISTLSASELMEKF
jgi:hypothetical protein